jgi:mannose-1-phosphate guanylyltransferase
MIYSDSNKNIVIRGLDHYIVVDTIHSLLIYPKDKEQEIKEVVKRAELKS